MKKNIMQTHIKILLLIPVSLLLIAACAPQMTKDLWNGNYAARAASKSFDKESDAFYAKETIEQKELRKKTRRIASL